MVVEMEKGGNDKLSEIIDEIYFEKKFLLNSEK